MVSSLLLMVFACLTVAFVEAEYNRNITTLLWKRTWPRVFDIVDGCPDDTFVLDCNYCTYCDPETGFVTCTQNGCLYPPEIDDWSQGQPCPRGVQFVVYGKLCSCDYSTGRTSKDCD